MSEFEYMGKISSGAGAFDNFKSGNVVNGTKEFLESNSLVAKIAFLLLVLVVFVIAVKFSSRILSWLFSYNQSPYLVDGMISYVSRLKYRDFFREVAGRNPLVCAMASSVVVRVASEISKSSNSAASATVSPPASSKR